MNIEEKKLNQKLGLAKSQPSEKRRKTHFSEML